MFMLDSKKLFNLALIVGAVQIIFGMFIKAFTTGTIGMGTGTVMASGDLRSKLMRVSGRLHKMKSSLVKLER